MAEGGAVWTEVILKTIKERPWKDGKGFGLWVVQKFKDGKSVSVSVRGGMYSPNKVTGEKTLPKEGLELEHFDELRLIYNAEVLPLLQIKKGTPYTPPAAEEPIEDVPW